ncbi:MAG: hypothetical protein ACRDBY_00960 [Cetobacterium sp.]
MNKQATINDYVSHITKGVNYEILSEVKDSYVVTNNIGELVVVKKYLFTDTTPTHITINGEKYKLVKEEGIQLGKVYILKNFSFHEGYPNALSTIQEDESFWEIGIEVTVVDMNLTDVIKWNNKLWNRDIIVQSVRTGRMYRTRSEYLKEVK